VERGRWRELERWGRGRKEGSISMRSRFVPVEDAEKE
jgi:hypothetical protein